MREALALADAAAAIGEIPVGAVAAKDGQIIGRGYNRREIDCNPFAHAELTAMREAAQTLGAWRLSGVTVFVTLEPCMMCAGALVQARVSRLVFGAPDFKAGAVSALLQDGRHNHRVNVTPGLLVNVCSEKLTAFFQNLRAQHKTKLPLRRDGRVVEGT